MFSQANHQRQARLCFPARGSAVFPHPLGTPHRALSVESIPNSFLIHRLQGRFTIGHRSSNPHKTMSLQNVTKRFKPATPFPSRAYRNDAPWGGTIPQPSCFSRPRHLDSVQGIVSPTLSIQRAYKMFLNESNPQPLSPLWNTKTMPPPGGYPCSN